MSITASSHRYRLQVHWHEAVWQQPTNLINLEELCAATALLEWLFDSRLMLYGETLGPPKQRQGAEVHGPEQSDRYHGMEIYMQWCRIYIP